MSTHYAAVLDELFPINWGHIAFRYHDKNPYSTTPEYSFILIDDLKNDGNNINVVVRMAEATSLLRQMLILHQKHPSRNIKRINRELRVKEWRINGTSCPEIKPLYDEFYQLSLQMRSDKYKERIASGVHGGFIINENTDIYTFRAYVTGGSMNLVIDWELWEHPFVAWAEKTRKALEKCEVQERN